jgi:hypothetical protein
VAQEVHQVRPVKLVLQVHQEAEQQEQAVLREAVQLELQVHQAAEQVVQQVLQAPQARVVKHVQNIF